MEENNSGKESAQETKETPQIQEQEQSLEAPESPTEQVSDPGQLEGKPKPKKEQGGPPEGSPRWEEIYWKSKEFDRQKEEFEKRAESEKLLLEHNRKMQEALEKLNANVEQQTQTMQTPKALESDPVESIESIIAQKREAKRLATSEGEYDKANDLQDEITDLLAQKTEIKASMSVKEASKSTIQDLETQRFNDAESRFIAENPWSNPKSPEYDPVRYGAAVQIHDDLARQGIVDHDKRFKMVQEKIESYFNKETPTAPMTASPVSVAQMPSKKDVELTEDEKRVAVRMFSNMEPQEALKEYSNQKKLMGGAL